MRRSLALLALALLTLTVQCRTANPERDAELASLEVRAWFDVYGESIECDVPEGGCKQNTYDVKYVDLCVSKGFQAKTCGCTAGCSGRVQSLKKPEAASAAAFDPNACDAAAQADLKAALAGKSSGQMKCLTAHVCSGDPSHCDAATRTVADALRETARGKCKKEVFGALCDGSVKDTLACGEKSIDALAFVYDKAFFGGDQKLRRCVRERFCNKNGSAAACDGEDAKVVQSASSALSDPGCDYWLATLCSIDGK